MDLNRIILEVNDFLGIDITKKTRNREYVYGRFLYYRLAKDLNKSISLTAIGNILKINHATVLHGLRQFQNLIKYEQDKELIHTYNKLYNKFISEQLIFNNSFNRTKIIVKNQENLRKIYG